MMKLIKFLQILVFLVVLILPNFSYGQMSGDDYEIESDVIGGTGDWSTSENYELGDTLGETATEYSSSTSYEALAGFWQTQEENYSISFSCDDSVNMEAISGTGQSDPDMSQNYATCTVDTSFPTGYKLEWQADSATMDSSDDSIGAYSPEVSDTPEVWDIAFDASEWGGHLGASSTTVDTDVWGTGDTYLLGKWLNVSTSPFQIAERTSATSGGDSEIIFFGAEIGASKIQKNGSYTVNVTITATSL